MIKKSIHGRVVKSIIVIVALFIMASCSGDTKTSNEVNENKESITKLKIAYIPISECAQLYIAKEKGFFSKRGLDVDFVAAKGGQNSVEKLYNKEVDIAFASFATLLINRANQNIDADKVLSIFGATYETKSNQNHAIFIRKDKYNPSLGIDNLKQDLKFGINEPRRMEHTILFDFLKLNKIDEKTVESKITIFPFSKMFDVIQDGTIDVACMVEPQITKAKTDPNLVYLGNQYLKVSNDLPLPVATFISLNSISKEKKEQFKKFAQAMEEATKFLKEQTNESKVIISTYTQISPEIMSGMGLPEFRSTCDKNDLIKIIDSINQNGFFEGKPSPKPEEILSDLLVGN